MSPIFTLSVVVLCVGGILANPKEEKLFKVAEKCREGTSITKELVAALFQSKMDMAEPDYPTKCYFKCLMHGMGLIKSDGTIELDAAHEHFTDCAINATQDDVCDKAYQFNRCIHMQHPELPIA